MKILHNFKIITALLIIIFLFIFFILIYKWIIISTININNDQDLLSYIEKKYNYSNISIEIKEKDQNGNLLFVYYLINSKTSELLILKQNKIIENRYSIIGSCKGNRSIDMYSFKTNNHTIIVVYGDNSHIKANKLVIKTTKTDNIYENIAGKNYILTIYKLSPNVEDITNIILFDKNNNPIYKY